MYIHHTNGWTESVPVQTPCTIATVNAGTEARWNRRHHVVPRRFFAHVVSRTTKDRYIATMPNATATGRNVLWSGATMSSTPNGRNLSIRRPPRWSASRGSIAIPR